MCLFLSLRIFLPFSRTSFLAVSSLAEKVPSPSLSSFFSTVSSHWILFLLYLHSGCEDFVGDRSVADRDYNSFSRSWSRSSPSLGPEGAFLPKMVCGPGTSNGSLTWSGVSAVGNYGRNPSSCFTDPQVYHARFENAFLIPYHDCGCGAKFVWLPSILAACCKNGRLRKFLLGKEVKSCCFVWQETKTGSHNRV